MDLFDLLDDQPAPDEEHFAKVAINNLKLRDRRPERDSPVEDALVERVFALYRAKGFPYVTITPEKAGKEFRKLVKTPSCLQEGGTLTQNMVGLTIANAFHPEMVKVRCRNFRTSLEVFESDDLFRDAIRHRIRYGDTLYPWGLRKSLASLRQTQRVSNFRPAAAKAVYEHFKPRLALDFSAGWGGRMLGAMASGTPYVGIDPHTAAVVGNQNMRQMVEEVMGQTFDVTLVQACAEDVLGQGRYHPDLIFTSPPYFDVEQYSDEPTQSYLRYPTEAEWYERFLGACVQGSFADLVPGGHLVLNINPCMEEECRRLALRAGFSEVANWRLLLSQHQFHKPTRGLYREEPVLVFAKPEQP